MATSSPIDPNTNPNPNSKKTATVTFGVSSFIARSLASSLVKSGNFIVRVADPLPAPSTGSESKFSPESGPISYFRTDFRDRSQLRDAIAGSSTVFHVVPSPATSDFYACYVEVVEATKNVVRVCRECGVERLVCTGSADVVFGGVHGIDGGDESTPYPEKYENALNELRAQAELLVLNANGRDGLLTCVLRTSNPFGPGDEYFVPFLVSKAKSGWAKFIIGSGKNMCDFTYVENVAHANICAERALCSGVASVSGKPFFITNNERMKFWDFMSNIVEGLGYERPKICLPVKLVLLLVVLVRWLRAKLGLCSQCPTYTPAVIHSLVCTKTYDCSKAQQLIGYSPLVSLEEGVTLTVESFSRLAKGLPYSSEQDFSKQSKAEALLGNGQVADILLWRDEKRTFAYLLGLFLLFYWFLLSGRSFISSSARFLLLVSVILFGQGILPAKMYGFTIEKIPLSSFEVSESAVRHSFISLASVWNSGFCTMKSVAQGNDWNILVKVTGSLYLVKLLLPISFSVLIGVGLTCLFTFFIVYEQYEGQVDQMITTAASGLKKLKGSVFARLPGYLKAYVHDS